jgi:hypothetical protein
MALWKFSNYNKHGIVRERIMYLPNGKPFSHGKGFGSFVNVRTFKYDYKHPYLSPSLYKDPNGKLFIVPSYQPVNPNTTLDDINWVRPKPPKLKVEKLEKLEFKFESKSSPGSFYKVTAVGDKVKCNCSGQYRAKNKHCIHLKTVKNKLGISWNQ